MKSQNAARAMQRRSWQKQSEGKTKEEISAEMRRRINLRVRKVKENENHETTNPTSL